MREVLMDGFAIAFLITASIVLVGVLLVGLTALLRIRGARRDRLQMKRHLGRIEMGRWFG